MTKNIVCPWCRSRKIPLKPVEDQKEGCCPGCDIRTDDDPRLQGYHTENCGFWEGTGDETETCNCGLVPEAFKL